MAGIGWSLRKGYSSSRINLDGNELTVQQSASLYELIISRHHGSTLLGARGITADWQTRHGTRNGPVPT